VCSTLLKLIMDGKEIDLLFFVLFCSIGWKSTWYLFDCSAFVLFLFYSEDGRRIMNWWIIEGIDFITDQKENLESLIDYNGHGVTHHITFDIHFNTTLLLPSTR
jgi:hypothetical protein